MLVLADKRIKMPAELRKQILSLSISTSYTSRNTLATISFRQSIHMGNSQLLFGNNLFVHN